MESSRIVPVIVVAALSLVSCGGARQTASISYYDLGDFSSSSAATSRIALSGVEVDAPSWLDSPAMQYRLAYADRLRRYSYVESRWVAAPGELLELSLRRTLGSSETAIVTPGCTLRLQLDEFVQQFESPSTSYGVVEVRVALLGPRSDTLVSGKRLSARVAAPTADAKGAVAALGAAVAELTISLSAWLSALERDGAPALDIARTCRGQ